MDLIGRSERIIRILDTSSTLMAEGGTLFTRAVEQAMARGVTSRYCCWPRHPGGPGPAAEIPGPGPSHQDRGPTSGAATAGHQVTLDGVRADTARGAALTTGCPVAASTRSTTA